MLGSLKGLDILVYDRRDSIMTPKIFKGDIKFITVCTKLHPLNSILSIEN